jgi:hypothetical protein
MSLPPIAAGQLGWHKRLRLPRDYYVRVASNDYSVHPAAIGRQVGVHASLEQVSVTCEGRVVASHPRCWASRQTITDPAHRDAAAALRRDYRHLAAVGRGTADLEVEERSLGVYDVLLGTGAAPGTGGEVA